jgi:hypothetical protein
LGHWDHYADVSQGSMRAIYSGAPTAPRDGRAGGCVHVVLDPVAGLSIERIPLLANEGI